MKDGCICISCKLEENILPMLVDYQNGGLRHEAIIDAMPAMTRIFGVMLVALEAEELEPTWRLVLDARCRALDLGSDALGVAQGRG